MSVQRCPVCDGDGQRYVMTPSYRAVVASAAGGSFGWTGPTHEWVTCHACAGRGYLSQASMEERTPESVRGIGGGSSRYSVTLP